MTKQVASTFLLVPLIVLGACGDNGNRESANANHAGSNNADRDGGTISIDGVAYDLRVTHGDCDGDPEDSLELELNRTDPDGLGPAHVRILRLRDADALSDSIVVTMNGGPIELEAHTIGERLFNVDDGVVRSVGNIDLDPDAGGDDEPIPASFAITCP